MMSFSAAITLALVAAVSLRILMWPPLNSGRVSKNAAMSIASFTHPFSQLACGRWANLFMPTHSALAVMKSPLEIDVVLAPNEFGVRPGIDDEAEPRGRVVWSVRRLAGLQRGLA